MPRSGGEPRRTKPRFNYEVSLIKRTVKRIKKKTVEGIKKKKRVTESGDTWFYSYVGDDENCVRKRVKRRAEDDAEKRAKEQERKERERQNHKVNSTVEVEDIKVNHAVEDVELVETVPVPN
ncbi:hypothetical protein AKJ57_01750 [candidate division MSBL1 archaeon SCGC-AAA259A05]|uniref:Uncharacterized protein n=1 Tax=candidate division MSBL1 archaeon SCGC-AAA259A05 TaxID=1698259 RepID=A0A133UAR3_9EURY|nr:hypothetical protein AKJ57_01750 [candidate division MSBL1 archaeon SCGC-AAA259A05]